MTDVAANDQPQADDETFVFPVSFAQQRLWLLDQLEPGRATYNVPLNLRLMGQLDAAALRAAFSCLIERHEVLRTSFEARDGEPMQVVHPPVDLDLPLIDLRAFGDEDRDREVARMVNEEGNRPFDLRSAPLLRATLLRLRDDEHVLLTTAHHIAADGWSFGILQRELGTAYSALVRGEQPSLPELPIQYADFAIWQRDRMAGTRVEEQVAYWTKQLAHPLPSLQLPSDRPRDPDRLRTAQRLPVRVDQPASDGVTALAREAGVTPFVVLLAAFQLLLSRYGATEDVIVGSPIAGRTRTETEGLIGFFVNTLALRVNTGGSPSFREFLARVRETVLGAMAHQEVPFERIVEAVQPERDRARNPLFDALFSLQDAGSGADIPLAGVTASKLGGARDTAKFDVQLILNATESGFRGALEYDADLFDEPAMRGFAAHYAQLVASIVANPESPVDRLSLMDREERAATLVRAMGPVVPRDESATVVSLFRDQLARTPDAIAVMMDAERLTYSQLSERAAAVTSALRARGVGRDDRVGICAERSIDAVAAVLGVLSAGAAYLPIDPAYPAARIAYMLQQSRARVMLATRASAATLPAHSAETLLLDELQPPSPATVDAAAITPDDLAYVLYTSGSTGMPKGVAMPHRALVNLVEWQRGDSSATVGTRTLQFASLSFDVSFQELFTTWSTGGTLVLVDEETRRDAAALAALIARARIERVFLPYIALEHLADAAAAVNAPMVLREIITAGEQLRVTPAIRALAARIADCTLVNQYGPTESHVVTAHTLRGVPSEWPALPTIGRPIDNVIAIVLDAAGEPVPDGVPGELYLGGRALARGYLDDPIRTAERFVSDRSAELGRLYRTGDLARVRGDGTLDYLGRADDQVKIRGFRVELGEIERVLSESPAIAACAVSISTGSSAERRIFAYFVPREVADVAALAAELRALCRERLPEYMIPAGFIPMERLPLTPSGKVDRRSLPAPDANALTAGERFVEPRSPVEAQVAAIWAEVLKVPRVGVNDNFFDLGGHSLLATRMVSRVRDGVRRDVSLRMLFDHPTLGEFVAAIERDGTAGPGAQAPKLATIAAIPRSGARRMSPPGRTN